MSLTQDDLARLLLAIVLLLAAAHAVGHLFARLRQPPVIGEIVGGLLLGPTVLGLLAPDWQAWIFADNDATRIVLAALYQVGLLLLMFVSGREMRSTFHRAESRTTIIIALTGSVIPFLAGMVFLNFVSLDHYLGAAQSRTAFLLVFAIAIAVTSIPVISRIFHDLKMLDTSFARIVLSAAVLQDVLLYVVLALALSMAGAASVAEASGGSTMLLPELLGLEAGSTAALAYHTAVTLAFFALALLLGPPLFHWASSYRYNLVRRQNSAGHLLVFLLLFTGVALVLGVTPMFGAFAAGIATSRGGAGAAESDRSAGPRKEFLASGPYTPPEESIKSFSFAFFIPMYFAIVGLRLDLVESFDPWFLLGFLVFASAVGAASVYVGAMLAGERGIGALNLSIAMNARGGPGIVLASVAFDAGIINSGFYTVLILLAILTSFAAGAWIGFVHRRGWPLR